jgi:hypothetical protein
MENRSRMSVFMVSARYKGYSPKRDLSRCAHTLLLLEMTKK